MLALASCATPPPARAMTPCPLSGSASEAAAASPPGPASNSQATSPGGLLPGHAGAAPHVAPVLRQAGIDPLALLCNDRVEWHPALSEHAKRVVDGLAGRWSVSLETAARRNAVHFVLGYLVRSYYETARPHNLGALQLRGHHYHDARGEKRPLLVFRSGLTFGPGAPSDCFRSLIQRAEVRHVINLYGGLFPFQDVIAAEKRLAGELGASFLDTAGDASLEYRSLIAQPDLYERNRNEAMVRLARLLRQHLLRPGNAPPRGNIYLHCAGGMHRSGMLFGVLRRCINGEPMETIEQEYRRHVAWLSPAAPGGFEELNLRFMREFDCRLLKQPAGRR